MLEEVAKMKDEITLHYLEISRLGNEIGKIQDMCNHPVEMVMKEIATEGMTVGMVLEVAAGHRKPRIAYHCQICDKDWIE